MAMTLQWEEGLAEVVRTRRKQVPQRMLVAGVVALLCSSTVNWQLIVGWLVGYGLIQALETFAFEPLAKDRTLPWWRRLFGYACLTLSAVCWGGLSVALWDEAGPLGGLLGVLLVSGAIVNVVLTSVSARAALLCTIAPHFVYLGLTPLFLARYGATTELQSAIFLGVVLYCVYATVLWRSMDQTRRREAEALRAAEEAARRTASTIAVQNAFVATISHELRTPISAMMAGASELGRLANDPSSRSHAALITDAGQMMKTLLDDILDHAKLEAGRMSVEKTEFDLRGVVAQAVRFWSAEARKKGLKLRVEGAAQLPGWVVGDPTRLRQILNNLISNAVKFTADGSVTLRLSAWASEDDACAVRFQVCDTGEGMDADQIGRLFRPFEQGGAEVAGRYGGTGLGLVISRQLAKLMEGHLTAFSVKGSGSVFTLALTFPLAQTMEATEEVDAAEALLEAVAGDEPGPRAAEPEVTPEPEPAAAEAVEAEDEGRPLRVLVADDHEINRRAVQLVLAPLGCVITAVENGKLAFEAATVEAFDVIVMDVRMPEMDGREATRRIRATPGPNQLTPVIAVTADTQDDDKAACRAAGMTAFVGKPIDPAKLVNTVVEVLEAGHQQEAEQDRQVA